MIDTLTIKIINFKKTPNIIKFMHRKFRFTSPYGYKGDRLIIAFKEWLKA